MDATYNFEITKIKGDKKFKFNDTLIREIRLDIYVNNEKIVSMMATPVDQEALAIGYLISEGIIKDIKDIENLKLKKDGLIVDIKAKINKEKAKKLSEEGIIVSGCGKSISANLDIDPAKIDAAKIESDFKIKASEISKQMDEFYKSCPLYEQTGCVHTARIYFDENNYFDAEDIAQHSTIDKAVGKAILNEFNPQNGIMMVSGRLSSEMVVKAVMHKIPVLISRTATTCLGFKIAEKFNLTLVGFARGDKMNVYTHDYRIVV
ncbi:MULTISPECIES: formate dehydrogenase accessory sulfurtransferase FdhD [unclassified Lebetimonas]|uniref:formate dehydrogenase accessory sulfurtransferase FdhD n=1 Tax=unclassified Lebetimonas TaxID=2648158 RepID=UPI000463368A|nr:MULTISPECIES: formate dehydrogenase accessory sulfurtransferase FdhD [unclassified Lebetimonas]